jgi:hypothetical protein
MRNKISTKKGGGVKNSLNEPLGLQTVVVAREERVEILLALASVLTQWDCLSPSMQMGRCYLVLGWLPRTIHATNQSAHPADTKECLGKFLSVLRPNRGNEE